MIFLLHKIVPLMWYEREWNSKGEFTFAFYSTGNYKLAPQLLRQKDTPKMTLGLGYCWEAQAKIDFPQSLSQ